MKHAQVRIGETISILFIFIVLVIMGFMFYARIQSVTIYSDIDKSTNARAIQVAQTASFMPELQCSSNNVVDSNCFDILKLENFKDIAEANKEHYFDEYLYSYIEVRQVYPTQTAWVIYNQTRANVSSVRIPVPILLYNATAKQFNTGIMQIDYYSS